jgi:hypothetical protein
LAQPGSGDSLHERATEEKARNAALDWRRTISFAHSKLPRALGLLKLQLILPKHPNRAKSAVLCKGLAVETSEDHEPTGEEWRQLCSRLSTPADQAIALTNDEASEEIGGVRGRLAF